MDGTFSQELLHIFQFDDINQKFTAILIFVESISGYRVLHYEVQNNIPYQIIQGFSTLERNGNNNRLSDKEYL